MKLHYHSITVKGVPIKYWTRGHSGQRTIVFLHGFKGNHKGLTELSYDFANCRVILPDLPGHGESGNLPVKHTPLNYAHFVEDLCQALGLEKISLVGHSYGATVALLYGAVYGQRLESLILISPTIPDASWSGQLARLQVRISKSMPGSWRKAWMSQPLLEWISSQLLIKTVSSKRKKELMRAGVGNTAEIRPDVVIQSLEGFLKIPYFRYASRIQAPTLVLAGEEDSIASLESQVSLGQRIASARFYMIGRVGHLAPLEMPGTVASIIRQFWAEERW